MCSRGLALDAGNVPEFLRNFRRVRPQFGHPGSWLVGYMYGIGFNAQELAVGRATNVTVRLRWVVEARREAHVGRGLHRRHVDRHLRDQRAHATSQLSHISI